jgi:hypothetical protein
MAKCEDFLFEGVHASAAVYASEGEIVEVLKEILKPNGDQLAIFRRSVRDAVGIVFRDLGMRRSRIVRTARLAVSQNRDPKINRLPKKLGFLTDEEITTMQEEFHSACAAYYQQNWTGNN